jgi:CIC family chloride channel protein
VAKFFQLTGINKNLPISNFSVVGMAGVLSGLFHSPLTAIFLIAEITGGYGLMVPLLIVSSISFAISKNMEGHSMDIKNLADTGTVFTTDKDKNILSSIDLSKLIQTSFVSITSSSKLEDVVKLLAETKQSVFPVVNEKDSFIGVIHFDAIRPIIFNTFQVKYTLLSEIIQRPEATVNYDEIMETVMEKFETTNASQLFVLKDDKCLGYVTKVDILDAYREKLKLFRIE